MTEYQLALSFWSIVLVTVVAAPFLLVLFDFVIKRTIGKKHERDEDTRPSLPSIPSWPSSPA
jgi:hypothetical protein